MRLALAHRRKLPANVRSKTKAFRNISRSETNTLLNISRSEMSTFHALLPARLGPAAPQIVATARAASSAKNRDMPNLGGELSSAAAVRGSEKSHEPP
jgi:hypothetical protein